MMVDYPAVKQLLADIEHSAKAKFVAEDIERHTQDPRFVTLLQLAIRDQQLPFNTQLAGAIVLSRVLSEMYFKWDEEILAQTLVGLIADIHVEHRIKETLQLNLTSVLEISSQNLFQKVVVKAAELIIMASQQELMQVQSESIDVHTSRIKSGTLILKCLVNSQAHFPILAKAICQEFLESTISAVKGLSVKEINTLIGIVQFWKEVFDKSRNGATKEHSQLLRLLSRSQHLTQWIFFIYQLDHLPGQQCYINPKSSVDHQHIMKLKVAAATLHKQILIGLELSLSINPEITTRHLGQVNGIINTICVFISYQQICEVFEEFIIELLGVTILALKLFRSSFEQNYDKLLHIVAFPLLSATEEEQQLFADDPAQFNNLAEDCCDKQSYGILKTEAAKLLQTICDDISNAATYTIQHAIISLKVRLSLDENLSHNVQNFLKIQQAFTILTILSYRIGKHQQELKQLRGILVAQSVIHKVNPLELTRIFQFLAYNYQEIYPHYTLGESWLNLALSVSIEKAEAFPSLAYSALDFISNVMENCFVESVAISFMQQNYNSKSFDIRYKILLKIIGKYFLNFSQQGLALALEKLLQAVLIDAQKYRNNIKSHTMDITQSLHACRRIAEIPECIANNSPVRHKLWEFVAHMDIFRKMHLDDQIVKLVTAFIRCEGLSPEVEQVLPKFLSLFRMDYSQTAYIVFLHEIAVRVSYPVEFGLIYPLLQGVKQLHSNLKQRPTSMSDSLGLATILLVLQNIAYIFGKNLNPQSLKQIAQAALSVLPISDQPQDKTQPIIIARALNLLFICHMQRTDERALRKMLQFSDPLLYRGHDLKVLTICLTQELFKQPDIVSVTQMIIFLVNSIWKAREQPIIKSKKNNRPQIKSTVIKIHKIANYQVCLKGMMHPFRNQIIPEFELRQALSKMKKSNQLLYQSIENSLPSKVLQRLRQLESEVTINDRRRKIVKTGDIKSSSQVKPNFSRPTIRNFASSDEEDLEKDENEEGPSGRKLAMKKKRKEEEMSQSNQ